MSKKNRNRGLIPPNSSPQIHQTQTQIRATYQGPLPDPQTLERYNIVVPDMAERLLRAFEETGTHRRGMDVKALDYNFRLARGGQIAAATIALTSLMCGTYLVATGHDAIGVSTMFGSISAMIGAFLYTARRPKPSPPAPPQPGKTVMPSQGV